MNIIGRYTEAGCTVALSVNQGASVHSILANIEGHTYLSTYGADLA